MNTRGLSAMNIPTLTSIMDALLIYYAHPELGNEEITTLFGKHAPATVARLKRAVKDEILKRGIPSYGAHKVNTEVAYEVRGLDVADDVADLEKRLAKLKKLND